MKSLVEKLTSKEVWNDYFNGVLKMFYAGCVSMPV